MRGKQAPNPKEVDPSGGTSRKSKITDEHVREAEKLKSLFVAFQKAQADKGVKITQSGFAIDHGIGTTQGLLWQYLNARNPLNLRVAMKFAEGLKCRLQDFSPRLAAEQAALAPPPRAPGPKTALQSVLELTPMEQQLLGLYRDLKEDQQHELLLAANEMHSKTHTHASPANPYGVKRGTREPAER